MRDLTPFERDMIYPAECHLKIIAKEKEIQGKIEATLRDYEVTAPVRTGNMSRTGRYQTFNVSVWIDDHQSMITLESALRRIEGVKTVL